MRKEREGKTVKQNRIESMNIDRIVLYRLVFIFSLSLSFFSPKPLSLGFEFETIG